ncbi:hypothetical protein BZA70DRAFT_290080 [Myxozyma melibiosi]|uniref:Transmembrane protein n=1 Tax=Myxozyma melibiosi TaxID=54550 RepID=A0ABR1F4M9_9ASCO
MIPFNNLAVKLKDIIPLASGKAGSGAVARRGATAHGSSALGDAAEVGRVTVLGFGFGLGVTAGVLLGIVICYERGIIGDKMNWAIKEVKTRAEAAPAFRDITDEAEPVTSARDAFHAGFRRRRANAGSDFGSEHILAHEDAFLSSNDGVETTDMESCATESTATGAESTRTGVETPDTESWASESTTTDAESIPTAAGDDSDDKDVPSKDQRNAYPRNGNLLLCV